MPKEEYIDATRWTPKSKRTKRKEAIEKQSKVDDAFIYVIQALNQIADYSNLDDSDTVSITGLVVRLDEINKMVGITKDYLRRKLDAPV